MKRRILSMFLALLMVFSLLPVSALAADESTAEEKPTVEATEPGEEISVPEAEKAAEATEPGEEATALAEEESAELGEGASVQEEPTETVFQEKGEDDSGFGSMRLLGDSEPENVCGDGVVYTLTEQGAEYKLAITYSGSGTGKMMNYSSDPAPWNGLADAITLLEIGSGVTYIGACAFKDLAITTLEIPASVTQISDSAFEDSTVAAIVFKGANCTISDQAFIGVTAAATAPCNAGFAQVSPEAYGGMLTWNTQHCYVGGICTVCSALEPTSEVATGSCGDKANWAYYANGVFKITGNGATYNRSALSTDFRTYSQTAVRLVVEEGISSLGENLFFEAESLTSITLPSTLTSVGNDCFKLCKALESVAIPEGVTSIGYEAFASCTELEAVSLPSTLTTIGGNAFMNCPLAAMNIPKSVTSIGSGAFGGCSVLSSITVDSDNTVYCSDAQGIVYSKDATILYICPEGKTGTVTVPDGVTEIGSRAFMGCAKMMGVTVPDSVESIGEKAFFGCSGLTKFVFPADITVINNGVLQDASSLESVTIPYGVTEIDDYVFSGCAALTSVAVPETVTKIEWGVFANTGLTAFTLPAGVTDLGSGVFSGCKALTAITADSGNTKYASNQGILYSKDGKELICCPEGKTGELAVAAGVTSVNADAVKNCAGLTSVVIPDGVVDIYTGAFSGCTSMAAVTIPATVEYIAASAFEACDALKDVYYSGDGTQWNAIEISASFNDALLDAEIHFTGEESDVKASGDCGASGNNLTWVLSVDGELMISGSGAMPNDYLGTTSIPWYQYMSMIVSVGLPEGITYISDYAFEGCSALTDVYYGGTREQWASVTVGSGNTWFNKATLHCADDPAHEHDYEITYVWADDGSSCTATAVCKTDETHMVTEDGTITSAEKTAATCEGKGTTTYTATFENDLFTEQTKDVEDVAAKGHDYGEPTYVWADDGSSCTATATCKRDTALDHIITETVTLVNGGVTTEQTKDPTCTEIGTTTYTATFTTSSELFTFEQQTTAVDDVAMLPHSYENDICTVCGEVDPNSDLIAWGECGDGVTYTLTEQGTEYKLTVSHFGTGDGKIQNYSYHDAPWHGYWEKITSLTIGAGVTDIGSYAFEELAITEVEIPASVTEINYCSFGYCQNLTDISFNGTICEMDSYAFAGVEAKATCPCDAEFVPDSPHAYSTEEASITWTLVHDLTALTACDATCSEAGCKAACWQCSVCGKYFSDESCATELAEEDVIIPALGHNFNSVFWDWNFEAKTCTGKAVCENDVSHIITETVSVTDGTITATEKIPATCETKGTTTYTTHFAESRIIPNESQDCEDIPALGHDYEVDYVWADDGSSCTATAVCKNDATHAVTEYGTVTSEEKTAATCESKGTTTYTAAFENDLFTEQTKDIEDIEALGHDYEIDYVWADDGSSCAATAVCKTDETHAVTEDGAVTSKEKTAATCESKGTTTYTATFEKEPFTTQTKDIEDLNIIPHSYDDGVCTMCGALDPEANLVAGGLLGETLTWRITRGGVLSLAGEGEMTERVDLFDYDDADEYENLVKEIVVGEGITKIAYNGFTAFGNAEKVTLPVSLSAIDERAFAYVDKLKTVIYGGTAEQWNAISVGAWNNNLMNAAETAYPMDRAGTGADGLAWSVKGGILTITGTGEMTDYTHYHPMYDQYDVFAPWCNYCELITSVVIGEGVTSIGSFAFDGCTNVTTLTVPTTIKSMGYCVFGNPNDDDYRTPALENIGYSGTAEQWNAISISYGNEIIVGLAPFEPNVSGDLRWGLKWTLQDGVFTVSGDGEMEPMKGDPDQPWSAYRKHIKNVIIGEGVTEISYAAFYECTNLTEITVPASVSFIDEYAFGECTSLKTVNYTGTKNQWSRIEIEEGNAPLTKAGRKYITEVSGVCKGVAWTLANGVLTLSSDGEDEGFQFLTTPWSYHAEQIQSAVVSEGVTYIGNEAFCELKNMKSVTLPLSLEAIGEDAFADTAALETVIYPGGADEWLQNIKYVGSNNYNLINALPFEVNLEGTLDDLRWELTDGILTITGEGQLDEAPWEPYSGRIFKIVIGSGVTALDMYIFRDCTSLNTVIFGGGNPILKSYPPEYWTYVDWVFPRKAMTFFYPADTEEEWKAIRERYDDLTLIPVPAVPEDGETEIVILPDEEEATKVTLHSDGLVPEETGALSITGVDLSDSGRALSYIICPEVADITLSKLTATTSNQNIATVKANKDGTYTVTPSAKNTGKCVITFTPYVKEGKKDIAKTPAYLTVEIVDYMPKMVNTVTLNTFSKAAAALEVTSGSGNEILGVKGIFTKDKSGKLIPADGLTVGFSSNKLTVGSTDVITKTTKAFLVFATAEGEKTLPLTVKVSNKLPKVTAAQLDTLRLYGEDNSADVQLTADDGSDIWDASYALKGYIVSFDNATDTLHLERDWSVAKPATSGKITVSLDGWRKEVTVTFKPKTATKVPTVSVKLNPATLTLSNLYEGSVSTGLIVTGDGITVSNVDISSTAKNSEKLTVLWDGTRITAKINDFSVPKGSYKFTCTVTLSDGAVKTLTLTVKVASTALKVKADSATATVYQSQSSTRTVVYTIRTATDGAKIGNVGLGSLNTILRRSLTADDSKVSWTLSPDGQTLKVYVTMKDTATVVQGKTYTLPLVITPEGAVNTKADAKLNLTLKIAK